MRLEGTVFQGERRLRMDVVELGDHASSFSHNLDQALLQLCKQMAVPLPLWLQKNTREFARFRQTVFFPEQFTEDVYFDQFHIKLLDK